MEMDQDSAADLEDMLESFRQTKPAKVSDLFILGMLAGKNLSGYDIYKAIAAKAEFLGSWFSLNKSTVYNTLARFTDEKFVFLTNFCPIFHSFSPVVN